MSRGLEGSTDPVVEDNALLFEPETARGKLAHQRRCRAEVEMRTTDEVVWSASAARKSLFLQAPAEGRLALFANREYRIVVMLRPQDVLVALKLAVVGEPERVYARLAESLGMSASEVHASVQRAVQAGLVRADSREPNRAALCELLIHGVRYVFPCERGALTRGMPTAHAAPPLNARFPAASNDVPPVWPDPEGDVRGEELRPLYPSVPSAARKDARLYELLALVDALRSGRAREREIAAKELRSRLL